MLLGCDVQSESIQKSLGYLSSGISEILDSFSVVNRATCKIYTYFLDIYNSTN